MSWNPALDPDIPVGDAVDAIETVIIPRARDLGGRMDLEAKSLFAIEPFDQNRERSIRRPVGAHDLSAMLFECLPNGHAIEAVTLTE